MVIHKLHTTSTNADYNSPKDNCEGREMKLLIAMLTLLLAFGSHQAAAFEKTAKYKTVKVLYSTEKPLAVGANTLRLHVTQEGVPLLDADVALKLFMPAMPGMPYMESKIKAENLGNGDYGATVDLSMRGTWQVHIYITTKAGKKYRLKSSLNL
jgi:hypothetical protein